MSPHIESESKRSAFLASARPGPRLSNEMFMYPEMAVNAFHYGHLFMTGEWRRRATALPVSDGRPVIGVSGTAGSDYSVWPIGSLAFAQYNVYYPGFSLGRYANFGREQDYRMVERAVQKATDKHGKKAIIVGHSLGGIMGRLYAEQHPEEVDTVVSLASPNQLNVHNPGQGAANPWVEKLVMKTTAWMREDPEIMDAMEKIHTLPDGVRGIAYFTKDDGVVQWQLCQDKNPNARCVEVKGTHMLLPANPDVQRTLPYLIAPQSTTQTQVQEIPYLEKMAA